MSTLLMSDKDTLVMKLLHYFITNQGYNPIVLHGAQNEIWLENLDSEYKIVRIVSNYIHNDEQFNYDILKTKQIAKKIKKKTFSFHIKTLSIFINLGDNVKVLNSENYTFENIDCIGVNDINEISNYRFVIDSFPEIMKETNYNEDGLALFARLSKEINDKSGEDARKAEDVFAKKTPYVTYTLILINVLVFIAMYIFGKGSENVDTLIDFGALAPSNVLKGHEFWRLITSAFIHIGFWHLLCNMYSLYVIGSQLESFYGKVKYIIIYFGSAVLGNLMSLLFVTDAVSAGASGAIFGLLGSLLYFGYHYRVYFGTVVKSQIIPLIVLNLSLGYFLEGINNYAHVGGLIGGILLSIMVGVKYKTSRFEKNNGIILVLIYTAFLIYMGFFR